MHRQGDETHHLISSAASASCLSTSFLRGAGARETRRAKRKARIVHMPRLCCSTAAAQHVALGLTHHARYSMYALPATTVPVPSIHSHLRLVLLDIFRLGYRVFLRLW